MKCVLLVVLWFSGAVDGSDPVQEARYGVLLPAPGEKDAPSDPVSVPVPGQSVSQCLTFWTLCLTVAANKAGGY